MAQFTVHPETMDLVWGNFMYMKMQDIWWYGTNGAKYSFEQFVMLLYVLFHVV